MQVICDKFPHCLLFRLTILLVAVLVNQVQANDPQATLREQFLLSASQDNVDALREFLAQGVDVDIRDENGRTALLLATYHDAVKSAQLLIEAGADVNAMDDIHDSPYLYAGAEGRLEILLMTLDSGADLSSVNRYGGTALIPAAHHGHVETVRQLLKTTVDIDHVNNLGWTALLEAIILGNGSDTYIQIVKLIVDAGADVNIPDENGVSPLDHAVSADYRNIAEILRNAAAINQD